MINKDSKFIDEPIDVTFNSAFVLKKEPECPSSFSRGSSSFKIEKIVSEWKDFSRRGRFSRNMRTAHAQRAAKKGSMGVGRFYFRVVTDSGRIFDLYFDRSSLKKEKNRSGWVLFREIFEEQTKQY